MSLTLRTLSRRHCRRLVVTLVLAVLFAGFAQAAHFHKDELAGHESQADIHCLLCLYAAGAASPSAAIARVPAPTPRYARALLVRVPICSHTRTAVYDARGPPTT